MSALEPTTDLNKDFSSDDATATPWSTGREQLEQAKIYWLTTVRPEGRPHVTPLFAAWLDGALYFCTGEQERKAKNLAGNPRCAVTTGCNIVAGLDVIVEGEAVNVTDESLLRRVAEIYIAKYDWYYEVRDGAFYDNGIRALVYQITPTTIFGFGKGEPFSQTRWRFASSESPVPSSE